jgi:hypothetical protein
VAPTELYAHIKPRTSDIRKGFGYALADKLRTAGYDFAVSASEIIKELPNLSEAERRAIREGLLEIANQDPDVALCNQAALDGALMLDRMEDEDARRQSR